MRKNRSFLFVDIVNMIHFSGALLLLLPASPNGKSNQQKEKKTIPCFFYFHTQSHLLPETDFRSGLRSLFPCADIPHTETRVLLKGIFTVKVVPSPSVLSALMEPL